jgi:hypothetical protein
MYEINYPEQIINLINLHLKSHKAYEEGMSVDSVKNINNTFFITGKLNYKPTMLSPENIEAVYLATVKDFQP